MKNFILSINSLVLAATLSYAQQQTNLNFNNANAVINTNAVLFYDTINHSAGYEIPKNSGNHAIYASSFWFGGEDINGQLRLAAQKNSTDTDFFTGPLSTFGGSPGNFDPLASQHIDSIVRAYGDAQITPGQIAAYNQIYTLEASTIQDFITWWNCDNGISPPNQCVGVTPLNSNDLSDILNWPSHGDVNLGHDQYLAPFYDNPDGPNGVNGIYDPLVDGDYPCIPGYKASYMILNDKGNIHSSGGEPIGLEIHMTVYQYASDDYLDNTTFVKLMVINRGTQTLFDFRMANFADPSVGDNSDDYVGSNPAKNLIYAYNSDNDDSQYGLNPPAVGVLLLNHEVGVTGMMNNQNGNPDMQIPETASEYWGYMNAEWGNSGMHFTENGNGYGGAVPVNYLYSDINTWSEHTEGNTSGDRQMFMATKADTLSPGRVREYDLAFIYARKGDHLQNVDSLFAVADSVKAFYDNQPDICPNEFNPALNTDPLFMVESVSFYPNPTEGWFKVQMDGEFSVQIYDMAGKLISESLNINTSQPVSSPGVEGIYLVQIHQNNKSVTRKLVVR